MIKLVGFIVLFLAWIFAVIMIFADKEHSMQWLIIMWILIIGMYIEKDK